MPRLITSQNRRPALHNDEVLAGALIDLVGFLNSPQRDEILLREANVALDRALFPLLVRLGANGALGVVQLANLVGRDHSTVSRQLAKLEMLGFIVRSARRDDQRMRAAKITGKGAKVVSAITAARLRLFNRLFAAWSHEDRKAVGRLVRKLADTMQRTADQAAEAR